MHRLVALLVVAVVVVGSFPAVGFARAAPRRAAGYIVVLRDDAVAAGRVGAAATDLARGHGLTVTNLYETVLRGFSAEIPDAALARLRRDPQVAAVVPDFPVEAHAETLPTGVDRIGADARVEGEAPRESGRPVAILDTGIDPDHPDLNVRGGYNCTSKKRAEWADDLGHGTHVAGIVGAKHNRFGVVGVAPGTPLYAVKVLDSRGFGSFGTVICGLDWTARQGIGVANLSLGGRLTDDPSDCGSSAYHQAFCSAAAKVQIVVSAGNSGGDAGRIVPAMYDQVTAVSALADSDGCAGGQGRLMNFGADDSLALFSSRGAVVDVAAPGVRILSTLPGNNYGTLSGTSMAAPHVAAAVALGWDPRTGAKEVGPDRDTDGIAEGILRLSNNVACTSPPRTATEGPDPRRG